jgi:hypothetical protein
MGSKSKFWVPNKWLELTQFLDNQDEGAILSILGRQNETALLSGIASQNNTSYSIRPAAFPALLKAYPDDARVGAPYNTGRGLLASGSQDKRVSLPRRHRDKR